MQSTVLSLGLAAGVLLLAGCTATIVAPTPIEPRPVYLLDHGRHTSLLLTDREGGLWRYAYGEWRWYVDFDRGSARAFGALMRPSTGALGRAVLQGPADVSSLQPQVGSVIETILAFDAEADRVDSLRAELDALFAAETAPLHHSRELMLDVIEHPVPYTLTHNSNHVVAQWLQALGFEVRGSPLLGRWQTR